MNKYLNILISTAKLVLMLCETQVNPDNFSLDERRGTTHWMYVEERDKLARLINEVENREA